MVWLISHWTVKPEGGHKRWVHAAVAVDDKIYSFGGRSSVTGDLPPGRMDISMLDTVSFQWQVIQTTDSDPKAIPFQRVAHSAVASGPLVYIWGGTNNKDRCNTLFLL